MSLGFICINFLLSLCVCVCLIWLLRFLSSSFFTSFFVISMSSFEPPLTRHLHMCCVAVCVPACMSAFPPSTLCVLCPPCHRRSAL